MKICIISALYPPYGQGGAESVAARCAAEFLESGHQVSVITAESFRGWKSFSPNKIQDGGITIYRFYPLNFFFYGNIGKYPFFARAIWHLVDFFNLHSALTIKSILQKEKPDIVATHNLKGLGFIVPFVLRKFKWIHTVHDVQLVAPSGLLSPGEQGNWLYSKITKFMFGSPNTVVSPSRWLLDFYASRGFFPKSEKKVVPNPVALRNTNVYESTNSQFAVFAHNSHHLHNVFLYLGQLEVHKGILFLIEAFKKFLETHPEAELYIAGDGALREEVESRVFGVKQIQNLGKVSHVRISELFSKVNATIIPSLVYENAPAVISESLSYGVPVIASRIGGIPEMVEEMVTGYLFEPGNAPSLISAMERFCIAPFASKLPQPRNYTEDILSLLTNRSAALHSRGQGATH